MLRPNNLTTRPNGGAVEWTQSWWTLRQGFLALSTIPNSKYLTNNFSQFEVTSEAEERHEFLNQPGKLRALFWVNRGRMANYNAAVDVGQALGITPDVALVRQYSSRAGGALDLEQQILPDLRLFARTSANNGSKEVYEFTEINQSISAGISLKGDRWHRPDDTFGLAGTVNGISPQARRYFAAGGLGVLIGDGQLPRYGLERILEVYYKFSVIDGINLTLDFQHVVNPAYNAGARAGCNFRISSACRVLSLASIYKPAHIETTSENERRTRQMHPEAMDRWTHDDVFLGADHARNERRTRIVIALCCTMMVAEIVGGILFRSWASSEPR